MRSTKPAPTRVRVLYLSASSSACADFWYFSVRSAHFSLCLTFFSSSASLFCFFRSLEASPAT